MVGFFCLHSDLAYFRGCELGLMKGTDGVLTRFSIDRIYCFFRRAGKDLVKTLHIYRIMYDYLYLIS